MYSWLVLESSLTYVEGKLMDGFTPVCTITADLSALSGHLAKLNGPRGDYWKLDYEVGILFGRMELEAMLIWKDLYVCFVQNVVLFLLKPSTSCQGKECRSKATVIPKQFA
jgi:hypothetical protein